LTLNIILGKQGVKLKFPDTKKIGLNREEVERLETIELPPSENNARNIWLISYYFAGMRISDVLRLRWDNFSDGRLWYAMGKNNKGDSLKIPDKAAKILEQYRENKLAHNLVFDDLQNLPSLDNENEVKKRIKARVHAINDRLKMIANKIELTKPLTNHISRHTFAQLAGSKIPLPVLQKLYRHTSIVTTMNYQSHFTNEDSDSALDAVLNP
jgi:integrase